MKFVFPSKKYFIQSLLIACIVCGCHPKNKEGATRVNDRGNFSTKSGQPISDPAPAPKENDGEIFKLTEEHTRIVWCENQVPGNFDIFADGNTLLLKGYDTQDGQGERALSTIRGNYARPLLSTDGQTILYTDKHFTVKEDVRFFAPVVFSTNWNCTIPVRLTEGYAVSCWRDPASGIEWVYAVRDFKPTRHHLPMNGQRLVRFRLDDPKTVETVYEETPVSPDNIQLSRDGTCASGLFPWPNAGVFCAVNGKFEAVKLLDGCCPSLAPDNSGVSWVFDGGHRSATFFADSGKKSWTVDFSHAPGVNGGELYHPRWSNHPRFLALTGPYFFGGSGENGIVKAILNNTTATSQVFVGKFSEKLEKVEAWAQVTSGSACKYYPDVWIEHGGVVDLKGFDSGPPFVSPHAPTASTWPVKRTGLVLLWVDKSAHNIFRTQEGAQLESTIRNYGAARYGRLNEMIFDGGTFQVDGECAVKAKQLLQEAKESAFEALVLPVAGKNAAMSKTEFIVRGPKFRAAASPDRSLVLWQAVDAWKTTTRLPERPFHLSIVRHFQGFEVFIDGINIELAPTVALPETLPTEDLVFGGGQGFNLSGVALYDRSLANSEIAQNARLQLKRVAGFAPPPGQVRLLAKLLEASPMPTAESIAPYSNSLVAYLYQVDKVVEGRFADSRVLVKHWALLGCQTVRDFPRTIGKTYELLIEPEADHSEIKGERVLDTLTTFDLEPWLEVTPPSVPQSAGTQ